MDFALKMNIFLAENDLVLLKLMDFALKMHDFLAENDGFRSIDEHMNAENPVVSCEMVCFHV